MYRIVALFVMLFAVPALADYSVNLSALDSLNTIENDTPLPLPTIKTKPVRTVRPEAVVKKEPVKAEVKEQVVSEKTILKTEPIQEKNEIKQSESHEEINKNNDSVIDEKTNDEEKPEDNKQDLAQEEITINVPVEQPAEAVKDKDVIEKDSSLSQELALIPFDSTGVAHSENSVSIVFGDGEDTLSTDASMALDGFAEKNKDNVTDKILIEAYHYDNGQNGFARKRISLNRAVNIRTYLLNKGFKGFDIQIINTEEAIKQNNAVVSR